MQKLNPQRDVANNSSSLRNTNRTQISGIKLTKRRLSLKHLHKLTAVTCLYELLTDLTLFDIRSMLMTCMHLDIICLPLCTATVVNRTFMCMTVLLVPGITMCYRH